MNSGHSDIGVTLNTYTHTNFEFMTDFMTFDEIKYADWYQHIHRNRNELIKNILLRYSILWKILL